MSVEKEHSTGFRSGAVGMRFAGRLRDIVFKLLCISRTQHVTGAAYEARDAPGRETQPLLKTSTARGRQQTDRDGDK